MFIMVSKRQSLCFADSVEFSTERISQMRTLVGSCRVDVGTCPVGACRTKQYSQFSCPDDGYICPKTETRTTDCGALGGVQKYEFVTQCGCCKDRGVDVMGTVIDSVTKDPLEQIIIRFERKYAGYTGADGKFKAKVKSSERSLVIRTHDRYKKYMDAVKVVQIPEGFRGPVEVELLMMKKAEPVDIQSDVETVLSLSTNPLDPNAGSTVITIAADSFRYNRLWGKKYTGPVKATVTFIDTNNATENIIPGRFLTPVGNTLENLISDGIASFSFMDDEGTSLNVGQMKFTGRADMEVWKLNTITGYWEAARVVSRRGKRQVTLDKVIDVDSDVWYNIDKIPGAPLCYFKARIFNKTSGDEITYSDTTSFMPELVGYTSALERLRMYAASTNTPNDTCFAVRCPVVSNPNDALAGFINMTSVEVIPVGEATLPYISYLEPKQIGDYDDSIETQLTDVQFTIAPNDLDIFVNYVSNSNGLFYTSMSACESSAVSEPALHFYASEPPNYEPLPDNSEICTARIAFNGSQHFYSYLNGLSDRPSVQGISVWEQDNSTYYYTDSGDMELFSVGGEIEFAFICLQYRCSDAIDTTTVYLDIDIPTVNVTYNYTDNTGSVVNRTYSTDAFNCRGSCFGPHCFNENEEGRDATLNIDGSFSAQDDVDSGPDFYDSATNDCNNEVDPATFAYVFKCYSKHQRTDTSFQK